MQTAQLHNDAQQEETAGKASDKEILQVLSKAHRAQRGEVALSFADYGPSLGFIYFKENRIFGR
jgi:hypothetical protein